MHTLIALLTPVFSMVFYPVTGGELVWTKNTPTTPVILEINGNSSCTVHLSDQEAIKVAHVMIDIVDNNGPGKLMAVGSGTIRVSPSFITGNVSIATNSLPACAVTLSRTHDEPEKVIDIFTNAGT